MDADFDDASRLRKDQRDREIASSRRPGVATRGAPAMVATTKSVTTYPSAAGRYFAVSTTDVTGTEAEGSSGALTSASGTFYALNLGTVTPPVGTSLLVTYVDNRWVFRYDG